MTSREKLRVLVERLSEPEAAAVLAQLETSEPSARGRLSFTAIGHSGRSDLSERSGDILRADFPTR